MAEERPAPVKVSPKMMARFKREMAADHRALAEILDREAQAFEDDEGRAKHSPDPT